MSSTTIQQQKDSADKSRKPEQDVSKNVPPPTNSKTSEGIHVKSKAIPGVNFKPNFIKPPLGTEKQEENLPLLTRNEENLKPNVKIHVEPQKTLDENWNDEIEEFCIPVNTPTTFDKYVKWQNMEKAAEEKEGRNMKRSQPTKSAQKSEAKFTDTLIKQNVTEKALPVAKVQVPNNLAPKQGKQPEPNAMDRIEELREVNSSKIKTTESLLKPVVNKPAMLPPKSVPIRSGFGPFTKKTTQNNADTKIADNKPVTKPFPSNVPKKEPSTVHHVVKKSSEDWDTEVYDEKVVEISRSRSENQRDACTAPAAGNEERAQYAPTTIPETGDGVITKTVEKLEASANPTVKEATEIQQPCSSREKLTVEEEPSVDNTALKALDEKLDQILQMKAKSTSKPPGKGSSMLDKMSKIGMNPNPINKKVGNSNTLNTSILPLQTESNDQKSSKPTFRQRPMKSVSKHSPLSQLANSMAQSAQKVDDNKDSTEKADQPLVAERRMDTLTKSSESLPTKDEVTTPHSSDTKEDHRLPALKQLSQANHTRYNDYQHLPRMPRVAESMAQKKDDQQSVSQLRRPQTLAETLPPTAKLESAPQPSVTQSEEARSTSHTNTSTSTTNTSTTGPTPQVPNPSSAVPGLPPHLAQAYLQYLQQSTMETAAASMGVLPNLLSLPLLPTLGAGLFPGMMPLANPLLPLAPFMGMPCNLMPSLGTVPPTLSNITQPGNQNITQLLNQNITQPVNQNLTQPANQNLTQPANQNLTQPVNQNISQPSNQNIAQPVNQNTNNSGTVQSLHIEAMIETVDKKEATPQNVKKNEPSQNEASGTTSNNSKTIPDRQREVTPEEFWLSELTSRVKDSQKAEAGDGKSACGSSPNEAENNIKLKSQTNHGEQVNPPACSVQSSVLSATPASKQSEPQLQDEAILSYRVSPTRTLAPNQTQQEPTAESNHITSDASHPLTNHILSKGNQDDKNSDILYRRSMGPKMAESHSTGGSRNNPYARRQISGQGTSSMQIPDLLRKKKEQTMRVQEMLNKLQKTQKQFNQQDLDDNPVERWA
ncbi:hypothetical protein FSP39_011368 [Pinctada imbricata]|uniref:Uncharacterized protein n=1 Tax=Pinctada imbricata TaxID=66713 RepID=A0AA88XWD8_PINIB|nr:hypothetical protein FSP39_011368 [Pinctada imbricata]